MTTVLHLVRHAEAAHETLDPGLSDVGERQALLLGRRLQRVPLTAVLHSPLRRAARTAEIVADCLPGVPVEVSEHLRDRTPVPGPGAEGDYPSWLHPWLAQVPSDESDTDGVALDRAVQHFTAADAGERHLLLVTHAFVVGWFVRHALDAPAWRWAGLQPANASLTVVRCAPDRPAVLVSFNDVAHLDES